MAQFSAGLSEVIAPAPWPTPEFLPGAAPYASETWDNGISLDRRSPRDARSAQRLPRSSRLARIRPPLTGGPGRRRSAALPALPGDLGKGPGVRPPGCGGELGELRRSAPRDRPGRRGGGDGGPRQGDPCEIRMSGSVVLIAMRPTPCRLSGAREIPDAPRTAASGQRATFGTLRG